MTLAQGSTSIPVDRPYYSEDEEPEICWRCHGYLVGPPGTRLCHCPQPQADVEDEERGQTSFDTPHANDSGRARERQRPVSAGRVLLAEGIKNGIEPPDELVREVLLRGRVTWVYAPAGTAKTWLALWIAKYCIEAGLRVLYFDAENGHRTISERLVALGVSTERLDDYLYYFPFPYLTTEPAVSDDYLMLLGEVRPDLIIFDSLVNFLGSSGLEENSNDDLVKWATAFTRPARERAIACLVLDHTPHVGDHARGASRKRDEADVMWALRSPVPFDRDTVGSVVLRRDKDREAWLPERVSFSVGGTEKGFIFRRSDGTIEEPNSEDGLTRTERRALDALRDDFGNEGATASEWLRAAKKRKVSEPSFWRAKRTITPPKTEGLVIVDSDRRFHAVQPPEPKNRDSRESPIDTPNGEQLSQLSKDYHDSGDSGTTITTITPLYRGDSSDRVDSGPNATPRESNYRRLSTDETERVRAVLADPPSWLSTQISKYREDPARYEKPTCVAISAEAFNDAQRWREVLPILESVAGEEV